MTTNKPEVLAYATHHDEPMLFPNRKEAAMYCDDGEEPLALIRLADYEVLRSECEKLVETLESVVSYDESAEDDDGNLVFHYSDMMRKVRAALSAHRRGGDEA